IAAKQRHTAKRIFERLRDEHGYGGGYTTVKDYVRVRRQQRREVFVPLWHPAGHGQADFGEAVAVIGGGAQKVHLFVMDLPQSDAGFVRGTADLPVSPKGLGSKSCSYFAPRGVAMKNRGSA